MESPPAISTMYCRKCGYQLLGLSENRCPECGRAFDPANPRSFCSSLRRWHIRRWVRRVAITASCIVAAVLLATGIPLGMLYWQWRAEHVILVQLKRTTCYADSAHLPEPWQQNVFDALFYNGLPPHESGWMGSLFIRLTERVHSVEFSGTAVNREDLESLAGLSNLESLTLREMPLQDEALAPLKQLHCLRNLTLTNVPITDAAAEHILDLPLLETVQIAGTRMSDRALQQIHSSVASHTTPASPD